MVDLSQDGELDEPRTVLAIRAARARNNAKFARAEAARYEKMARDNRIDADNYDAIAAQFEDARDTLTLEFPQEVNSEASGLDVGASAKRADSAIAPTRELSHD